MTLQSVKLNSEILDELDMSTSDGSRYPWHWYDSTSNQTKTDLAILRPGHLPGFFKSFYWIHTASRGKWTQQPQSVGVRKSLASLFKKIRDVENRVALGLLTEDCEVIDFLAMMGVTLNMLDSHTYLIIRDGYIHVSKNTDELKAVMELSK